VFLTAPDEPDADRLLQDDEDLDVEWRLGVRAVAFDPTSRSVTVDDGVPIVSDAVRAGHRRPRPPAARHGRLAGVHELRTLDDARALRAQLGAGGRSSSVAVASSAPRSPPAPARSDSTSPSSRRCPRRSQVRSGRRWVPQSPDCTPTTGCSCAPASASPDCSGRTRRGGRARRRAPACRRRGRRRIGAQPDVAWLADSGLDVDGGVRTDATCATAAPGVVAVGDCGLAYDVHAGRHLRAEHWTHALQQPATAAATLLGSPAPYAGVPYVWSEQYRPARAAGRVDRWC
jgi:NADPH-dependent 2,4-dienoyl-CoA reductase/sulfur reductase-like enzyme